MFLSRKRDVIVPVLIAILSQCSSTFHESVRHSGRSTSARSRGCGLRGISSTCESAATTLLKLSAGTVTSRSVLRGLPARGRELIRVLATGDTLLCRCSVERVVIRAGTEERVRRAGWSNLDARHMRRDRSSSSSVSSKSCASLITLVRTD